MNQLTRPREHSRHVPRAIQQLRPTLYISSYFGVAFALLMLIPALIDVADGRDTWSVFVLASGGVFCVSVLGVVALKQPMPEFSPRFGFLLTTVLWGLCSIFAAVPFWLSPLGMTPAAAYFEAMSGLTTTGATVLSELDLTPRSFLMWRSLLQWLGGIGIIAVGLFLFPFLRIGGMQVFRTESSDRSDKTMPRVVSVTRALCAIYVFASLACAITYAALGMSLFDAINHAMTTVATGGFSTHDRSFGFFEDSRLLWAAVFFMCVGALPFLLYVEMVVRGRFKLFSDWQVRTFFVGIIIIVLALSVWLEKTRNIDYEDALTQAAFNVVSVVTTTGFASDDYAVWGPFAFGAFFILTFIGGCSGSTTGGIKVYRFIITFQALRRAFTRLVYPNAVQPLRFGDKRIEQDVFDSVVIYFVAFFLVYAFTILALSLAGQDFVTALTGAQTALTNVGPGLGETIGPAGNFAPLGEFELWLLSFVMLLGRLEIMTVLILFTPVFWRD
ncbi:TrkH family potassium uptake protein [Acuticoccus sp. MNP-M23]|uniref:TrkH family potassium uptake protein n=1 Tax=Acuticoccus sp. MNP-M23 TaxID=3072793 RepID=UPI002816406B|nr:TrkH family potassium uptake protein [Acuticoccus sp. MNP-M23]WMS41038.1 TrkH family potassium uptake protein [Acuticoccus sp. MNP-M23]